MTLLDLYKQIKDIGNLFNTWEIPMDKEVKLSLDENNNVKVETNSWIPVEESLPDYGEIVLVHIDGESGVGEMFSERVKNPFLIMTDENDFKLINCEDNITHWMRIPKIQ